MLGMLGVRVAERGRQGPGLPVLKGGWGHTPGQRGAVDFVVVDEIHVLQHAQDGLERAEGRRVRGIVSFKMGPLRYPFLKPPKFCSLKTLDLN